MLVMVQGCLDATSVADYTTRQNLPRLRLRKQTQVNQFYSKLNPTAPMRVDNKEKLIWAKSQSLFGHFFTLALAATKSVEWKISISLSKQLYESASFLEPPFALNARPRLAQWADEKWKLGDQSSDQLAYRPL